MRSKVAKMIKSSKNKSSLQLEDNMTLAPTSKVIAHALVP